MLSVQNLNLFYSYKHVLNNVSASFDSGKYNLILGENGAGKSSLVKIICGDIKPTSGKILLDGEEVSFNNPKEAIEKGICLIHQRPLLADSVSILENLMIGLAKIDQKKLQALMADYIPNRKPTDLVKNLNLYERVAVVIIGALLKNPKIIILDEPSALLTLEQRAFVRSRMKEFVKNGGTVIVISHFVKDAFENCDNVLLLKNGNMLLQEDRQNVSLEQIGKLLFQKEEKTDFELAWPESLHVKFVQKEIDETNFKRITADGRKVGLVPADRTFRGANPNLTILQLMTVYNCDLKQKELESYAQELLKKADVNIKITEKVSCLSGGMLQRLILQREISQNPDVLYLCEPRQGLDINAIEYLFGVVGELEAHGVEVIVQEAAR